MTAGSRPSAEDDRGGEGRGARIVPMRLQKFLARSGAASRRGSEDLMTAGRVTVNAVVVSELGAKVDPLLDEVAVDGNVVRLEQGCAYYALNKPAGYVTTMSDPQGRPTVRDLFPKDAPAGLFPVGRLDFDTEGLLLLTTDGELGHVLTHPSHHVWKTYLATVDGVPSPATLVHLRTGVELDDGMTAPAEAKVISSTKSAREEGGRSVVELKIREGRKRQVRRMLFDLGHPVRRLVRVGFGPIPLGELAAGEVRALTSGEVDALRGAGR
jgi:23S rRNA pseudouridine2605 synthase